MKTVWDARHELASAAAGYLGAWHWDYVHPENPHGDAQMELAESVLDRAVDEYVKAREANPTALSANGFECPAQCGEACDYDPALDGV